MTGTLTIPNTVTSIGEHAFDGCSSFTGGLIIPNSVTSISEQAFSDCSGLTGTLTIPNTVTDIGDYAFAGCSGFTGSLTFPKSWNSINQGVFFGCSGLTGNLMIPNNITKIHLNAFSGCSGFTGSLTIPNGVILISDYAFKDCSGFTGSLTIPNGVTYIGDYALENCKKLEKVYILSKSYSLESSAFEASAPVFYGYIGTPIQDWAAANSKTFIPFSIKLIGLNTVQAGKSVQLSADSVFPPGVTGPLVWSSNNPAVASVDQSGLVRGLSLGTADITSSWDILQGALTMQVTKGTYDMSGVQWNYSAPFVYDGTQKAVTVIASTLPPGVTVTGYTGNTGSQPGNYVASALLVYDAINYQAPGIPALEWKIVGPTAEPTASPASVPTTEPTTEPTINLPGDANSDGQVDIMDLVAIIDYIVSDNLPASMINADANGDGEVDIMDLVWIIDNIVNG